MSDDDKLEDKPNHSVLITGSLCLIIIFIIFGYVYYASKNNVFPFDPYKRILSQDSKLTEMIPGAVPVPLTAEELANRDSYFVKT